MIYLAAPYSHPDVAVMEARYHQINRNVLALMADGRLVYSPITHNHVLAQAADFPRGWQFWAKHDLEMLRKCEILNVLKMDGWQESVGVQAEIEFAREMKIPVFWLTPIE